MAIEIKNINKSFHGRGLDHDIKVLDDVNLNIGDGEFVCLLGPSGCGKTTLLRLIAGLDQPTSGEVIADGEVVKKPSGDRAVIFQQYSLFPWLTVLENVMFGLNLKKDRTKEENLKAAERYLESVGLIDFKDSYPHELSGGMRQRVMIAIALACEPKLLIADEPTTALDVTIQAQILELMMELKDKLGMAIIMITHDLGIVASMCDRIAVMYAGRIVETGTCDEIFYHPKHEYTKGLLESIPRLDSTKHEKLIPIEGNPVDLLNPPEGCAFAPRCKNCMKICLRENPPKTDFSETHYAHCFMNQKACMEGGNTNE